MSIRACKVIIELTKLSPLSSCKDLISLINVNGKFLSRLRMNRRLMAKNSDRLFLSGPSFCLIAFKMTPCAPALMLPTILYLSMSVQIGTLFHLHHSMPYTCTCMCLCGSVMRLPSSSHGDYGRAANMTTRCVTSNFFYSRIFVVFFIKHLLIN